MSSPAPLGAPPRPAASDPGTGDVLELSPRWTRWSYWLLVSFFVAAFVYCMFGTVREYASGPAIVWIPGRIDVTATVAGTVSSIDVRPGQRVGAGDRIIRFHSANEEAELARIEREFDTRLVQTLRDPTDRAAREVLTALAAQKELARAQLEQLSVRAPRSGVVGDVRIRAGQLLRAGDIVVTLVGEGAQPKIVAMLPARYRPQLAPGMPIRFEVDGYRYAYQRMAISSVAAQIIGPDEVQRYLGQELDDTLTVTGPVALVEATPPSASFTVDGQEFSYYHGMNGIAEACVRSESILLALVPGLRLLFQDPNDGRPRAP